MRRNCAKSGGESLLKSATITFPHGSRVIAVPGKPDTVRGFSANVLIDRVRLLRAAGSHLAGDPAQHHQSLRGGIKKVRLITTPNGIGNKAHDIWVKTSV
jgi:phage FluMu gp28-like protein